MDGFGTTFHLDQDRNGGGITLSIRNSILAKVVSSDDNPIKVNPIEFSEEKMAIELHLATLNIAASNHIRTVSPRVQIPFHSNTTI